MGYRCFNCGRLEKDTKVAAQGCQHASCGFAVGRWNYEADPVPYVPKPEKPRTREKPNFWGGPVGVAIGIAMFWKFDGFAGTEILALVGIVIVVAGVIGTGVSLYVWLADP